MKVCQSQHMTAAAQRKKTNQKVIGWSAESKALPEYSTLRSAKSEASNDNKILILPFLLNSE